MRLCPRQDSNLRTRLRRAYQRAGQRTQMRSDLGLWSYWMTLNDGPSPQSVGKMWARLRYESDHGPRYRRLHKGSRSVRRQIPCAAILHPRCEARVEPHTMGSGFRSVSYTHLTLPTKRIV